MCEFVQIIREFSVESSTQRAPSQNVTPDRSHSCYNKTCLSTITICSLPSTWTSSRESLHRKRTQAMLIENSMKVPTVRLCFSHHFEVFKIRRFQFFGCNPLTHITTLALFAVLSGAIQHLETETLNMPRCTIHKTLSDDSSSCVLKERAIEEIKLSDIREPHQNDVLMGRGGKNNQHVGNEQLRGIARGRSLDYQNASKKGKSSISRELVRIVREMKPPGRYVYQCHFFVRKDLIVDWLPYHSSVTGFCARILKRTNGKVRTLRKPLKIKKRQISCSSCDLFSDVGNDIAREKTSQVLRDAVAYTTAPPPSPSKRPSLESKSPVAARNDTSFQRQRETEEDEREYLQSAVVRQPAPREVRSPSYYHFRHPYINITPQPVPFHLPVTPASSEARKRPRFYESPLPSYHNTPSHYLNTPSHPLGVMLSPPPRNEAARRPTYSYAHPGNPAHTNGSSFLPLPSPPPQPHHSTARSQYVPSNLSENMNPAVNTDPLPIDASTSGHGDFDLFGGELLSDACDRDESLSPLTYPEIWAYFNVYASSPVELISVAHAAIYMLSLSWRLSGDLFPHHLHFAYMTLLLLFITKSHYLKLHRMNAFWVYQKSMAMGGVQKDPYLFE